jgi:hypothetical protein
MRMARKMTAKIGAVLPLSGPLARVGEQAKIGVDLAATEINAAGGILQASVEIGYRDNRSDPATADAQARALIDQQVIAIVGPVSSAMRDAMAPTMARHKTPLLAWPRHRLLSGKADIKSQAKPTDLLELIGLTSGALLKHEANHGRHGSHSHRVRLSACARCHAAVR